MPIPGLRLGLEDGASDRFAAMCGGIAASGQFVLGPYTDQLQAWVGAEFGGVALAYSSCTDAQQAYLTTVQAEVCIMVGYSFPSTMVAAVRSGARLLTVDCDPFQMTFALDQIRQALETTQESRVVVMLSHLGGYAFEGMAALKLLCQEYGALLAEDISHSWGAYDSHNDEAGHWGDVVFASLFATKPLHAATGGVVILRSQGKDSGVYDRLVSMREYGCESPSKKSVLVHAGGSWRLSEMEAALFIVNYWNYSKEIARRNWIIKQYLEANPSRVFAAPPGSRPNGYRAFLLVDSIGGAEQYFQRNQIGLVGRVYESPGDQSPILQGDVQRISGQVSTPELKWSNGHVCLPCYGPMSDGEVYHVCSALRSF